MQAKVLGLGDNFVLHAML